MVGDSRVSSAASFPLEGPSHGVLSNSSSLADKIGLALILDPTGGR